MSKKTDSIDHRNMMNIAVICDRLTRIEQALERIEALLAGCDDDEYEGLCVAHEELDCTGN